MKTLLTTSILVIITYLISIPTGVVLVILAFLKGSKCNSYRKTFNIDMKFNRLYKNDIYELASVMIFMAIMYDGFNPSTFEEPLDIPATTIQICVLFFVLFRGMEEKVFRKKNV